MAFGDKPFGLRDVKVVGSSGSAVDLPSARTLSFNERVRSGELSGDDKTVAVVAYADAVEWQLEAGGISLEAYAELTGRSVVTAGTTPNQTKTLTGDGGDVFPYVKVYGKSIGDGDDDVHVKIWKAKVMNIQGQFADGEFFVTQCNGVAISDGVNGLFEIVQNETATDLPAT
jgi:hypothetical protein